ncbi:DUF2298 domain-containing protein [Methanofollis fontis]|uniref:YYY membrane protein n=1 Tax=Methanofollis fontis TaxID=2052832 RepID=A0A483CMT7_9EURY|nr:DUF2298 domain-containing protein [Methanofollis fontis]TAJ44207.1 hypothetical protein CUJ86_09285 [Methanofollis fontis]
MSPEMQALMVVSWLILLKFLQVALWPRLAPTLHEYAYPAAYPLSILVFGAVSWYAALIGLPVWSALLPFLILAGYAVRKGEYTPEKFRPSLHWDAVFIVFFCMMLGFRFVNPSISFAEKFMDHAFLASIMRDPAVPPLDPWFAGGYLDVYYYLGYWIVGALGTVAAVPSTVAFNLGLPTVLGASAVTAYAIGRLLVPKVAWITLILFFLPDPAFFHEILLGSGMQTLLWNSTRVIDGTINEYTAFSFLWGDLHPHVVGIFVQFLLIFLIAYSLTHWEKCDRNARILLIGAMALALGSMPPINSWDVLLYAPLVVATGILIWRRYGDFSLLLAVPPLAVLVYAPYYLMLNSAGVEGAGMVTVVSDPIRFLLVFGFFLAVLFIRELGAVRHAPWVLIPPALLTVGGYISAAIAAFPLTAIVLRRRWTPTDLLLSFGLLILIACEFVFLKDNMGGANERLNTVFKCYSVAWILIGTGVMVTLGEWITGQGWTGRFNRSQWRLLAVAAAVALLITPFALNLTFGYDGYTLDGIAWVNDQHPGDADAVAWLRGHSGEHVLVEAVGSDYSYAGRVSAFTGIPAILGQPFHEQMWRDDWESISGRKNDVQAIYEEPTRSIALMDRYGADLLYVGDLERQTYQIRLPSEGLETAWEGDGVTVYRRT